MRSSIRAHLRSNIVGYIALFCFAMSGTAIALDGSNTVFSDDIVNGQVQRPDLALNAVGTDQIQNNQVRSADIKSSGVAGSDIAANEIGSSHVVDNSLGGGDINESSLDLGSFFASAKAGVGGVICTADAGPQECAGTNINLPRASRLMIVASGQWWTSSFAGGTSNDVASGACEIQVDDVATDSSNAVGEQRTAAGAGPWTQFPAAGFARGTLALTDLTGVLPAGSHWIDVTCSEADPDVDWANVRVVAARVG